MGKTYKFQVLLALLLFVAASACSNRKPVLIFAGRKVYPAEIRKVESTIKGSVLQGMDPRYAYILLVGYSIETRGNFTGDYKEALKDFQRFIVERTGKIEDDSSLFRVVSQRKLIMKEMLEQFLVKYNVKLK